MSLRIRNLGVNNSTPTSKLILTVLGGIAQFEREIMRERQHEGIARRREVQRPEADSAGKDG